MLFKVLHSIPMALFFLLISVALCVFVRCWLASDSERGAVSNCRKGLLGASEHIEAQYGASEAQ